MYNQAWRIQIIPECEQLKKKLVKIVFLLVKLQKTVTNYAYAGESEKQAALQHSCSSNLNDVARAKNKLINYLLYFKISKSTNLNRT